MLVVRDTSSTTINAENYAAGKVERIPLPEGIRIEPITGRVFHNELVPGRKLIPWECLGDVFKQLEKSGSIQPRSRFIINCAPVETPWEQKRLEVVVASGFAEPAVPVVCCMSATATCYAFSIRSPWGNTRIGPDEFLKDFLVFAA